MNHRTLVAPHWIIAAILALTVAGTIAVAAQSPTVTSPAAGLQRDMSAFCATAGDDAGTPPAAGSAAELAPDTTLTRDSADAIDVVVSGSWVVPVDAWLAGTGHAAELSVTSGSVTVVSCQGKLIFDTEQYDDNQYELPAGTGVALDVETSGSGIYLSLGDEKNGVWIVGSSPNSAQIWLHILSKGDGDVVCGVAACWGPDDAPPPNEQGRSATPASCPRVRCWSW